MPEVMARPAGVNDEVGFLRFGKRSIPPVGVKDLPIVAHAGGAVALDAIKRDLVQIAVIEKFGELFRHFFTQLRAGQENLIPVVG